MGRPPSNGGPAFRFTQNEVVEMEACLQEINNAIPSRESICALAEKFSGSPDRVGKFIVQPKQVWNWFQNRRYSQRAKLGKAPGKLSVSPMPREDSAPFRNDSPPISASSGNSTTDVQKLYRLQVLQTSRPSAPVNLKAPAPNDPSPAVSNDFNMASQRIRKPHKLIDVNTNEVTTVPLPNMKEPITVQTSNSRRDGRD